jgi:hypothetical protein
MNWNYITGGDNNKLAIVRRIPALICGRDMPHQKLVTTPGLASPMLSIHTVDSFTKFSDARTSFTRMAIG